MESIHYLLLLDSSESMKPFESHLKKHLLSHFKKIEKEPTSQIGDSLHLGFFNTQVYPITELEKLTSIPIALQQIDFKGYTALYDAIGQGIIYLQNLKRPGQLLLILVTDGYENVSQDYSSQEINSMLASSTVLAYLIGAGWNLDCIIEKYPIYEMINHRIHPNQLKEIIAIAEEVYKNLRI
jgi:hypothetical protein